jgi:CheY-like chemotaxis protein
MKPVAVTNGEDALLRLEQAVKKMKPFPVVLLDIQLEGNMDGFDVAEAIQSNSLFSNTDVIIISKSQKASDRERFGQMGLTRFLSKPFSHNDLLENIREIIISRQDGYKDEFVPFIPFKKEQDIIVPSEIFEILLVEDNIVNQEVAVSMLRRQGHAVTIANNGEEAMDLLAKKSFDIILMDVQMPKMNGYETTQRIRQMESRTGNHVSIIGLTANSMIGDKEKCLQAGMDDYLSKPMRRQDLLQTISRVAAKNFRSRQG